MLSLTFNSFRFLQRHSFAINDTTCRNTPMFLDISRKRCCNSNHNPCLQIIPHHESLSSSNQESSVVKLRLRYWLGHNEVNAPLPCHPQQLIIWWPGDLCLSDSVLCIRWHTRFYKGRINTQISRLPSSWIKLQKPLVCFGKHIMLHPLVHRFEDCDMRYILRFHVTPLYSCLHKMENTFQSFANVHNSRSSLGHFWKLFIYNDLYCRFEQCDHAYNVWHEKNIYLILVYNSFIKKKFLTICLPIILT